MRPTLAAITDCVDRLRSGLTQDPSVDDLARIEDVLSEGYAYALECDSWLMAVEPRLIELADDRAAPGSDVTLRALLHERALVERELSALRSVLGELRRERDGLPAYAYRQSA